jgi:hypothetical protein
MDTFVQPTQQQLEDFKDGDPVAIDEVVTLILPQIYRWCVAKYHNLPKQEVESTVNQVFTEICLNYYRYDSSKSRFTTYVINLVKKRMADLWEKELKLMQVEREMHENQPSGLYKDIELEQQIDRNNLFATVAAQLNEVERAFLILMREGENRLEIFIATLDRFSSVDNPEREVNTIKERIRRRIKSVAHQAGFDQDIL